MRITVLSLLLTAGLLNADRLPPVDESAQDPSFLAFKTKLLAAIDRKDVKGLLAAIDPKIRVSFGGDGGIEGFRRFWKLDKPAESKVWSELGAVLRLGATRDEPEFIAPYVFTRFPPTLDAFANAAVIRPKVVLRKSPAATAPAVATLDYDIVQLVGQPRKGWVEVRTDAGQMGWVQQSEIRSPVNYRAFFEKKSGQWKITAFIAGD